VIKSYAEKSGIKFNWIVLMAWISSFGFYYGISYNNGVFLSFLTLPAFITCGVLHLMLSKVIYGESEEN
jgi:hypothetical protein